MRTLKTIGLIITIALILILMKVAYTQFGEKAFYVVVPICAVSGTILIAKWQYDRKNS